MDILFVTPEAGPYSDGPAATVASALPKGLKGLEHRITVLSPLYRGIDPAARQLARRLTKLEFELGGEPHACEVYDGRTPGGVDLLFVGHEELFHGADAFATQDEDEVTLARRTGAFAQAVCRVIAQHDRHFDLVHAHDWPGAAALFALSEASTDAGAGLPRVLTIHDVQRQGIFDRGHAGHLGIAPQTVGPDGAGHEGRINLLAAGIRRAQHVTTGSPTYADEIRKADGGHGLEPVLGELDGRLTGIPSGVDVSIWNPATDPHLVARFDPMDRRGKARCKADLQRQLGLPPRPDVPLVIATGSTAETDGFDLLAKCGARVLRNDVQLALQLSGDAELIGIFQELSDRWPDRLQVRAGDDEELAHRLVAAGDFLIAPARHAPSGSAAMIAHRYGAVPIVRRTGGLADVVVDCDPALTTGTGIAFEEASADDVLASVQRACATWTRAEAFAALGARVMRLDHSWERSARLYERLYREIL